MKPNNLSSVLACENFQNNVLRPRIIKSMENYVSVIESIFSKYQSIGNYSANYVIPSVGDYPTFLLKKLSLR